MRGIKGQEDRTNRRSVSALMVVAVAALSWTVVARAAGSAIERLYIRDENAGVRERAGVRVVVVVSARIIRELGPRGAAEIPESEGRSPWRSSR